MDFATATARRDALEAQMRATAQITKAFPRNGMMGLPEEHVRTSPEFVAAKTASAQAFANLRKFNLWYTKQYASEIRATRRFK